MIDFIFPYRLHRLAYLLRGIAVSVAASFLYCCTTTMDSRVWWASFVTLIVYHLFFIILPRLRDVRMSGWWLLAILIPGVDIVIGAILLFRAPVFLSDKPDTTQEPTTGQPVVDNPKAASS